MAHPKSLPPSSNLMQYPKAFQALIHHFSSLPSIGPKAAERIVLYLFKQDPEKLVDFAESLEGLPKLSACKTCFNIAEDEACIICSDTNRDQKTICVVEEPLDIFAFERLGNYEGVYHVLGGVLEGSKNDDYKNLRIAELVERAQEANEIILATNPTSEGDLTALFIRQQLLESSAKVTRLARGLSSGGDIEYVDELTLKGALQHREEI
jgi:recombination protein RecR